MQDRIPWRNRLGVKLSGTLLGLLVVSLLFAAADLYVLWGIRGDAAAMNHSGRGRMRGYQMLYLANRLFDQTSEEARSKTLADLHVAMASTERRFSELRDGAPALGIQPATDRLILDNLREREEVWQTEIKPALERVMGMTSREEARPALEALNGMLEDFVVRVDETVGLYQKTSEDSIRRFQILQYLFVVIVIGVAASVIGIAQRIARCAGALAATADRITAGEFSLQAPVSGTDEIAAVGKSFNRMTARLQDALALVSAQEAEMRMILNSTADGIIAIDEQGSVMLFNKAATEIFGYDAEDVVRRNVSMLMPEPYRDEHDGYLARYLRTGVPHVIGKEREVKGLRRDGTQFPLVLRVQEMHEKGSLAQGRRVFVGVVQDITERKKLEEARHQSEERYRTLAESAEDHIFIVDGEFRLAYVNAFGSVAFGRPPSELVGKRLDELFPPTTWDLQRTGIEKVLTNGVSLSTESPISFGKHELWLSTRLVPIRDAAGQIQSVLGVSRDVTEQKRLEEQFRQVQKLDAVGRLAGGIAHDFNNLLTAILGYANILLDDAGRVDKLPNESRGDLEEIRKAAERAADLTRQLLAFSRKQIIQPTVVNLNDVVTNIERMLRRLIGENIDLRSTLAPHLGRVRVDVGQIEQVLVNLAVNARDAMPAGGRLTIETANVDLDEHYARAHVSVTPGGYVMLAVSDNGVGMSPEVRARLFEPFFTTKSPGQGTGLGLATVYGIVKQHGGNIWVYSEPEQGATFKIYLPLVDEAPADARPAGQAGETLEGNETVLLVEDEEAVRALARRALARHGYTVLEACSGEDALRVTTEHAGPVHLVLTDLIMPGMNGQLLAQRLTEHRPDMKVLYMSGYTDNAIVHQGVLAPDVAFLQKPFTPKALARAVRQVLDAPAHGAG